MNKRCFPASLLIAGLSVLPMAQADTAQIEAQCGGCHALTDPGIENLPVTERASRKGPPLYYAGNKFRREWLLGWLQQPERIRPAGYFPPAHTKAGPEGDVIDQDSLAAHPSVSATEAEAMTDYLMSLRPFDQRLADSGYEPGSISWKMGNLTFGKFNGCDACHRDAPDYGGVSGPELYSAWKRLQPEFITSYIADPVAWDAHTLMPGNTLNAAVIKKLTNYLKVNGEDFE